jgi:hypothetical protein
VLIASMTQFSPSNVPPSVSTRLFEFSKPFASVSELHAPSLAMHPKRIRRLHKYRRHLKHDIDMRLHNQMVGRVYVFDNILTK